MKIGLSTGPNWKSLVYLKEKNVPMYAWNIYGYIGRFDGRFDDDYSCNLDWIEVVL